MPKKENMCFMGYLFGVPLWLETTDDMIEKRAKQYFESTETRLKKLDGIELKDELKNLCPDFA